MHVYMTHLEWHDPTAGGILRPIPPESYAYADVRECAAHVIRTRRALNRAANCGQAVFKVSIRKVNILPALER